MNRPRRTLAGSTAGLLAVFLTLAAPAALASLAPHEVLVVVNDSSPVSIAIGDTYEQLRQIPAENVFHLPFGSSSAETISRTTYNVEVRDPIATYLEVTAPHLKQQILCIVTTKGVPLRVSGTHNAAVDSELTQLFTGNSEVGVVPNGYLGEFVGFRRYRDEMGGASHISYMVTRLTGYQTDIDPGTGVPGDILALMNRSVAPEPTGGVFLLDRDSTKTGGFVIGNTWMQLARDALDALGETTVFDDTPTFVSNQGDIVGYVSWGSNDCCDAGAPYYGEVPGGSGTVYPGSFLDRSITTTYVSTSGRTFTDGSQNYGQSLIADLVRVGASGGGGHVYEPFLNAVPQPQFLFPAYVRGYSAAEAYTMSIASLSWMNTLVVDPLMTYRDFGAPTLLSLDPAQGELAGGQTVTVEGLEFREEVDVLFDGIAASDVTWVGLDTLEVVTPPGQQFGPVDVTVSNAYGADTLVGAYEYVVPPVDLSVSTTSPGLGEELEFTVTGPPGSGYGLLIDLRSGMTCTRGICFDLAFTGKLTILHDSILGSDDPIGPVGEGAVVITVPNKQSLVGRFLYAQGVVQTSAGVFEVTPLALMLVVD